MAEDHGCLNLKHSSYLVGTDGWERVGSSSMSVPAVGQYFLVIPLRPQNRALPISQRRKLRLTGSELFHITVLHCLS